MHLGNAVHFCVTAALAKARNAEIRLRIDDLDTERVRPEYVADIFTTLHWLGIAWQQGPRTPAESDAFSQRHRIKEYDALIGILIGTGQVYGCTCTRSEIIARTGSTTYDGLCRARRHDLTQTPVLRFFSQLPGSGGDFIIRRRDMLPGYHIASLADDIDYGINLIVRGEDLLSSTMAQRELAMALGARGESFLAAEFIHHPLIPGRDGEKLSKTQGAGGVRDASSPKQVFALADHILQNL